MHKPIFLAAAAACLASAPLFAADQADKHNMNLAAMPEMHGAKVAIEQPWARASVGRNGAAYFTVVNRGTADVSLVGVAADVARRVELHTHKMDGGIVRMRPIEYIVVPAGSSVTLKPGGHHVMLMGLKTSLKEGDSFPLTATFEKAGKIRVTVKVGKIGAVGPADHMHPTDGHDDHRMRP